VFKKPVQNARIHFEFSRDFILLLIKLLRKRPSQIWIGDSHCHFIARSGETIKTYSTSNDGKLVIWLGPRLLYSVSKHGFRFDFLTKLILYFVGRKAVLIIALGEIDCRVHFVLKTLPKGQDEFFKIANDYKIQIMRVIQKFGFTKIILLTPVPATNLGAADLFFPRNGSLFERVLVTKLATKAILNLSDEMIEVVGVTTILQNSDGSFDSRYTDDGVHVNAIGAQRVLDAINLK